MPGSCQLRVAPSCRVWLQTRLHNVLGLGLRFTVARQRIAQRDVDCQLSTREARGILGNASCVSGRHSTHVSRRNALNRTRAPASRKSRAKTRSVGTALFFTLLCSHARRSVVTLNVHRRTATFTNFLSDGKGQMQAFQHQNTEQMRSDGEFRVCGGERQGCTSVASRVRP